MVRNTHWAEPLGQCKNGTQSLKFSLEFSICVLLFACNFFQSFFWLICNSSQFFFNFLYKIVLVLFFFNWEIVRKYKLKYELSFLVYSIFYVVFYWTYSIYALLYVVSTFHMGWERRFFYFILRPIKVIKSFDEFISILCFMHQFFRFLKPLIFFLISFFKNLKEITA